MINKKNSKAVIFDMDGILLDSEPLWAQAEAEIYKTVGIDINQMTLPIDTFGLTIKESVASWYSVYPWDNKTQSQVQEEIIDCCLDKITQHPPYLAGVNEALELCKSLDLKIAVASSSVERFIYKVIEILDIAHYFSTCCSAEFLKRGKPHPEVYLLAAENLDVPSTQCVSIEDSVNGMVAAKAARMRSIVVPSKEYYNDPRFGLADVKLRSLTELKTEYIFGIV